MKPPLTREAVLAVASPARRLADPVDAEDWLSLVRLLYDAGRRDLPLGRLLEGHVDAVQIVTRLGSPRQVERATAATRDGRLFGVWNADRAGAPTRRRASRTIGCTAARRSPRARGW